jgi:hypothetical protein
MKLSRSVVGEIEAGADDSEPFPRGGKAVPIMEPREFFFMVPTEDQEGPKRYRNRAKPPVPNIAPPLCYHNRMNSIQPDRPGKANGRCLRNEAVDPVRTEPFARSKLRGAGYTPKSRRNKMEAEKRREKSGKEWLYESVVVTNQTGQ